MNAETEWCVRQFLQTHRRGGARQTAPLKQKAADRQSGRQTSEGKPAGIFVRCMNVHR